LFINYKSINEEMDVFERLKDLYKIIKDDEKLIELLNKLLP